MNSNNPASRLLKLIEAGNKEMKDQPASEAWSTILNVPGNNRGLLLARVGHVMALPGLIRSEIERLDHIDHDLHLKWLPKVEASFAILNFQTPWQRFIDRYDGEVLYGMQICADALSRHRPERIVQPEHLENLLTQVQSLLDELNEIELASDLKEFMYEHLSLVRNAIEEYRIRGIKPIEAEVERLTGTVIRSPWVWPRSRETDFGRRFWKAMGNLALITNITVSCIQIGNDVFDFPSGGKIDTPNSMPSIEIIINAENRTSTPEAPLHNSPGSQIALPHKMTDA